MAKFKRRISDSSNHERPSKTVKVAQPGDPTSEQTTAEDDFQVEVKLRSASKAKRNDPRPLEYWEEKHRTPGTAMNLEDTSEASASTSFQSVSSGRVDTVDEHQITSE
jgi:hypothetical protein